MNVLIAQWSELFGEENPRLDIRIQDVQAKEGWDLKEVIEGESEEL